MPKVSPLQSNFNTGEVSPLLYGRTDAERYKAALGTMLNYVATLQGAAIRRSGTKFVDTVKTSANQTRLIPFQFSLTQSYMLEFGAGYVRFFANGAMILADQTLRQYQAIYDEAFQNRYAVRPISTTTDFKEYASGTFPIAGTTINAGNPMELQSPYLQADLFQLKFAQSADVLYITHPNYPLYKLQRFANDYWTLQMVRTVDGPYLNPDSTLISGFIPSAVGTQYGIITLKTTIENTITGAANNGSGLIRITSTNHQHRPGDKIVILGVNGTTEANNTVGNPYWVIDNVSDANHFDLRGSAFVHAYTSGGLANPYLFTPADLGRSIRIQDGTKWVWGFITTVTNGAHVQFKIMSSQVFSNTTLKTVFRLGIYKDATGITTGLTGTGPGAAAFFQDRLWLSGTPDYPQRLDGSVSSDYENFQPSNRADGTVADSDSCSFTLNAQDVNAIRWLASEEKGLLAGSYSREWAVRSGQNGDAITPTNVNASSMTNWGSADAMPAQNGRSTLFIQRQGRKLRELTYFFQVDGFRATDMTELSEHISIPTLTTLAAQKETQPLIWALRSDGVLACMTYDRDDTSVKVGWHRHILGGVSDTAGSAPIVESIAVIPSIDLSFDQLWMIVKRYINGQTVRTIEILDRFFNDTMDQDEAYFLDCGDTFDNPVAISGVTQASPAVVTANGHGLANGNQVRLTDIIGPTDLNDKFYKVQNVTTNTFEIVDVNDGTTPIDTTGMPAYISGGNVRKMVTTISGIDWLEGETISVLGDGATHPDVTVSGGAITLQYPISKASFGYAYNSDGQMLRSDSGAADGTAIGKTRRVHRVGFMLHRTGALKVGKSLNEADLQPFVFREQGDEMGRATPLFSGIFSEVVDFDYDFDNLISWRQSDPLPGMIQSVSWMMVEQDR